MRIDAKPAPISVVVVSIDGAGGAGRADRTVVVGGSRGWGGEGRAMASKVPRSMRRM